MARNRTRQLILAIIETDDTLERTEWRGEEVWRGRCIHCNTRLVVALNGDPISRATIEHILPRNHGGTDDLRNLALACARCNHGKGVRHDNRRRGDPKLEAMITRLQERREARWVEPVSPPDPSPR